MGNRKTNRGTLPPFAAKGGERAQGGRITEFNPELFT
jgi:hypothetical protein